MNTMYLLLLISLRDLEAVNRKDCFSELHEKWCKPLEKIPVYLSEIIAENPLI